MTLEITLSIGFPQDEKNLRKWPFSLLFKIFSFLFQKEFLEVFCSIKQIYDGAKGHNIRSSSFSFTNALAL